MNKVLTEGAGLLRSPSRVGPLLQKIAVDTTRIAFEQRHLYSYTKTKRESQTVLPSVMQWILDAQQLDGGIAAYYSLLTGYSKSYPEVTGYLIPTLYDCAQMDVRFAEAADRATRWLISLQMPNGSFPGGLQDTASAAQPSVFNTGQILQGLIHASVRAHAETSRPAYLSSALAAGEWLTQVQQPNGSWSGPGAYQGTVHTYYSMVAWALAALSARTNKNKFAVAAEKNLDWVLAHQQPNGWFEGIHLQGHPNYLHFIAYILQGALESAILLRRRDAVDAVAKSAWVLLRKFETDKYLCGAYEADFKNGQKFICLTGNSQMACIWLRLFEATQDPRFLNAALKINQMLKGLIPLRGRCGIAGGVAGAYPIWGRYQPFRYISWGCKFFADALILEERLMQSFAPSAVKALACAS